VSTESLIHLAVEIIGLCALWGRMEHRLTKVETILDMLPCHKCKDERRQ